MRILYVDPAGPDSAQMLSDNDVIGMPIAIAQCLLRVWHEAKAGKFAPHLNLTVGDDPWVNWASASTANYIELWNYGSDVIDEHYHRFGCRSRNAVDRFGVAVVLNATGYRHGMDPSMCRFQSIPPLTESESVDPFPMSIEAGRELYVADKGNLVYTHREPPSWLATN